LGQKVGENGSITFSGELTFELQRQQGAERCRAYVSFKRKKKSFSGLTIEAIEINPPVTVASTTELSYMVDGRRYIFWETPLTE
jgi:hypothetical protein